MKTKENVKFRDVNDILAISPGLSGTSIIPDCLIRLRGKDYGSGEDRHVT